MSPLVFAVALLSMPSAQAPRCNLSPIEQWELSRALGPSRPFIFCLPHDRPIRRVEPFKDDWLNQVGHPSFVGSSRPGQFFTFQIGVLARQAIPSISVRFSALRGGKGSISGSLARCISLGGIDMFGKPFRKALGVGAGRLQPLWCGWDVPKSAHGTYRGTATVKLGSSFERIPITLQVTGTPVADWGADDPKALTRLRWLDSTAGQGASIPKPFVPVKTSGRTIQILGRKVRLNDDGFPAEIISQFSAANTKLVATEKAVLASPIRFVTEGQQNRASTRRRFLYLRTTSQEATWVAMSSLGGFDMVVHGRLDFTGSGQLAIRLKARRDMDLRDLSLEIPFDPSAAKYMMGLNRKGGLRPASHLWNWDVARQQDCFWLGDVNAGLMVRLKGSNYRRPLLNIYYSFLPLLMPDSWGNGGKGGVRIAEANGRVVVRAFSGSRHVRRGQSLDFTADIYLTPFRTIDTEKQWRLRFIHPHPSRLPQQFDDALATADPNRGPNVIDVHQATYYNPYINYPYSPDSFPALADLVKRAHQKGLLARVYYTTREITQNMPELYALHSLNGEVVFPGPGKDAKTLINPRGPEPWLIQNLGSEFIPAWVDHVGGKYTQDDISVITTPDSRWNNFYLEGLRWMVDRAKLDGVYIDDTALDASSLRRARRILSARPDPVIDLHTWNHFNEWAGFANNLNLYMEVLPYLDRLWLGEGFNANEAPWDYWLVEMSGLPFGLMSEMLDGPNAARGLVFGETGRLGWSGDPRPMWRIFDQFGIKGTEMIPFFVSDPPVRTDNPQVLATVFRGKGRVIVAVASWADRPVNVRFLINWKKLGMDPATCELLVPDVSGLQPLRRISPTETLSIVPKSGTVVAIRTKAASGP